MAKFKLGQRVVVRAEYPKGHIRTPHYIRGKTYYIREGNEMLALLCAAWESEGKIIISGGKNANA